MRSERRCQVQPCHRTYVALGFCGTHYSQFRKGKLPGFEAAPAPRQYKNKGADCAFASCTREAATAELCDAHYQQQQRGLALRPIRLSRAARGCRIPGCRSPHEAHGYCGTHYAYARGAGEIEAGTRRPTTRKDGYVLIWKPGHPNAQKSGYVKEHIFVMAEMLGRPVGHDETVHHINGVRGDNRAENLELWVSRHCKGQRVVELVEWAKELLQRYEPDALA